MIDQIILSCNEDLVYMEFWKPVSTAYKLMFPDVKVHLAFLTNRSEDDELVKEFRTFGEVTLFKPIPDVPEFGQAKMIRFILASQQGDDVCYIDDIDLFPLSKAFISDKIDKRPKGVLLCVGGEVYGFNGCYPISQITAEGDIFKQFINPNNKSYRDLILSWTTYFYDVREKINIDMDMANDRYFSDERLLKRLLVESPVPKLELKRGYDDYLESTIDRHTFNKESNEWNYDRDKLTNHGYVNAHGARPYEKNKEHYLPILKYIEDNYGTK